MTDVVDAEGNKRGAEDRLKSTLEDNSCEQYQAHLLESKKEREKYRMKHGTESDKVYNTKRNIEELNKAIERYEDKIKNLMDICEYRMRVIEQRMHFKGTAKIAKLVKKMRLNGEFSGNVYGPVATEINVESRNRSERQNYYERIAESSLLLTLW